MDDFEADFLDQYAVEPVFTEIVVSQGGSVVVDQLVVTQIQDSAAALADIFAPAPVSSDALASRAAAMAQELGDEHAAAPYSHNAIPFIPWAPGPLTWTTGRTVGNQAVIEVATAYSTPDGHSSSDMPEGWGLEIEVNQTNPQVDDDSGPIDIRPYCVSDGAVATGNDTMRYLDDFWAARHNSNNNGIDSWSVQTEQGAAIDHGEVGFYWDWVDTVDACERQTMSVGIAYPAALPANSAGVQSFIVQLRAPRGWPTSSEFNASYQAVYNSCAPASPSSWCMNLPPTETWPSAADQSGVVVTA